jgi:hypothetical protein
MSLAEAEGYSAAVRAELHIGGMVLDLAEIGPEHCVLRTPAQVPTGRGRILVAVDGDIQETAVDVLNTSDSIAETLEIHQLT